MCLPLCWRVTWALCTGLTRCSRLLMRAGIMYTAMPRAELVGTARFVDQKNRLCCEVVFGKVPGAEHPLLQRTDSCQAELFTFTSSAEPREPQVNHSWHSMGLLPSMSGPWCCCSAALLQGQGQPMLQECSRAYSAFAFQRMLDPIVAHTSRAYTHC